MELTWALPDDSNDDIGIAYSAYTLAVVSVAYSPGLNKVQASKEFMKPYPAGL